MGPLDHYRYLTAARRRLFERVRLVSPEQYRQQFPFGLGTIRRTLHHMAGTEWYLIGQIRGGPEGEYPFSTDHCPDGPALEKAWGDLEHKTIETLEAERDWDRIIEFRITVPSKKAYRVKASPARIFAQFAYHEVHHRAQVMAMLRQLGAEVESMDFIVLAGEAVPDQ